MINLHGVCCSLLQLRPKQKSPREKFCPQMEVNLDPALWSYLPEDLVETILRLHIRSLSTSCLVQYRLLNKDWNSVIVSSEFYRHDLPQQTRAPHACSLKTVFCTFDKRCVMSLDTEKSEWLHIPLNFLLNSDPYNRKEVTGRQKLQNLETLQFIATDGGLLCFSTSNSSQLIVCNLITKCWKYVSPPPEFGREESLPERRSKYRRKTYEYMDEFLVGLAVDRERGEYKLAVTSIAECSDGKRATMVYSSSSKSWKKIDASFPDPLHQGQQDYVQPVKARPDGSLTRNGSIYVLVKYEYVHTVGFIWRLLKFDTKNECWSIVPLPRSRQPQWTCFWWQVSLQLLEHRGRLVLLECTSWRWFEFYMLEESDSSKPVHWVRVLENLTREIGSFVWLFPTKHGARTCVRCVGQGECLYLIEENFDREPKPLRVLECRNISSGPCSRAGNFQFWESDTDDFINQSRCWMYQPSLTPVA